MLLRALAARQRDGAPLSPPMSSFSVSPLILPPCLHSVNLSFFCCDSSSPTKSPREMHISKWSAPLFLTYSIPSVFSPFLYSSITVPWLLPPSASPFILSPESSHPHSPPAPPLAAVFLNYDKIYRRSSWRLISQHNPFLWVAPFSPGAPFFFLLLLFLLGPLGPFHPASFL